MKEMQMLLLLLLSLAVMTGHQVKSQEGHSSTHQETQFSDKVIDQSLDPNILAGQCHMISSIQNSMIQVMSAHYEFEKGIHGLHSMVEQTNQDISDLKGLLLALEETVLKGPPDSQTIHKDDLQDEKVLIKLLVFFEGFLNEGLKENDLWLKSHRLAPDFLHFVGNVSDALDFQQERADFLYQRLHSLRRQVRKLSKLVTPPKVLPIHPHTNQLTTDTDLLQKMVVQQQEETEDLKTRVIHLEETVKNLLKKQQDDARQFKRSDTQFLEDCPPGFVRHRSSCYRFVNQTDNWIDAEKHCQSLHPFSHLVAIETKDEEDFIHLYRRHNAAKWTSYYMWLGGSDMFLENSWVWVGTYSSLSYTNWLPGQPSNHNNEQHCIYFRTEGSDKRWDDWNCYAARMNYVCEIIIHAL